MLLILLVACQAVDSSDPKATNEPALDDSAAASPAVLEVRLRASYEIEEGLNLADGEVIALDANNETEPEAEHADVHASLGRYIGLSTYSPSGQGRLCAVGLGYASIAEVPLDGCDEPEAWTSNALCAVNADGSEPACVGLGVLVRPLSGEGLSRIRVVVDELVTEGDYLAGISLEVQAAE